MANISAMNNDELRRELRTFGVDAAITDSTRKVYEKKLHDLQKGVSGKRSKRPSTTPSVSSERGEDHGHESGFGEKHGKRPTTTPSFSILERVGSSPGGQEDYEHEVGCPVVASDSRLRHLEPASYPLQEYARPRLSFTPPYHATGLQRDYSSTYTASQRDYSSAHSVLARVRSAAQDTPTSRSFIVGNLKAMAQKLVPRLSVILPFVVIVAVLLVFTHHLFGWPDVFPLALLGSSPPSPGNDGAKAMEAVATSVVEEEVVVVPSRSFLSMLEPDEI